MSDTAFDLIVIGAGPGGYVAAIRAAQLGLKTAVVEREHLGGICLNWGCIPTKALLRSAEVFHQATHATDYGLVLEGTITADAGAVVKRSRGVASQLNGGIGFLLRKNKVPVIWGEAVIDRAPAANTSACESKALPLPAAKFVMHDTPATAMPHCRATMVSGTVLMPTASAPSRANARISAGVS